MGLSRLLQHHNSKASILRHSAFSILLYALKINCWYRATLNHIKTSITRTFYFFFLLLHFILGGSKITLNSDFNHDIKMLAPWKKSYDKQCIQKQRHHFADKALYSQSYSFPVVMYRCESWTIKKAEDWRTDSFELWYWRRLLRVPWTVRRSNQSILKEINPEYSLEGLMLKLKFQYIGHLMLSWLIGKDSDAGKDWRQEEKGVTEDEMVEWHHWLMDMSEGSLECCSLWGHRVRHHLVTEQQQSQS